MPNGKWRHDASRFTHHEFAAHYDDEALERMRLFIQHGANPTHEGIRKMLLHRADKQNDHDEEEPGWSARYQKRLMTVEMFNKLKDLGYNIDCSDFELIDTSDIRTIPGYKRRRVEENDATESREEEEDEEGDY